jgi:serine/threonine protein kinase/WD40 repeat protein
MFGDYEIVSELGRGGMGVVYLARHTKLKRMVALKLILSGQFAGRSAIERFRTEAEAAAALQHPNIITIYEVGEIEGQAYFTMELVEGSTLMDLISGGPLLAERAAKYAEIIARAVSYAHERGVLHRDLKPSNVLIDIFDQPKITDFGLAKLIAEDSHVTLSGQPLGSPGYVAPEQFSTAYGHVSAASDVYSLGALIFHLITGRAPFAAGTAAETLHQALHNDPLPPRALNPNVPLDLQTLCLKCLEKEPQRRYESAKTVAEELARFLRGEPLLTRPITPAERVWRWCRRNPTVAALGGIASLLPIAVLLALGLLVSSNLRIREERNQKDRALQQRAAALEEARTSEQRARDELFQALRNEARARRFSRQMGQRLDSLKALEEAARLRQDESLRDEVTATLALADIQRGPRWSDLHLSEASSIVFDDLYQHYARLGNDGTIGIHRVSDHAEIQSLGQASAAFAWKSGSRLSFSSDGKFLAELDYTNSFRVWRLADGKSILFDQTRPPLAAAFSGDGQTVVVATPDTLRRFDLSSGRVINHWSLTAPASSVAFNPDNRRLAVGYLDSDIISIYDADRGAELATLFIGPSSHEVIAWHPDGKHLAAAGSDPRIQIWDVESKDKTATLEGHGQQVTTLSFHPGGGLLASASWDGGVRLWDPIAGSQVMEIPFGPDIRFSKDGRWLGFGLAADDIELWAVTANNEYFTLAQGSAYEGDISPDGSFLALGMEDGVRVWDLRERKVVASRTLEDTGCALFIQDGNELLTCGYEQGLQRWPIQSSNTHAGSQLSLGPAQPIPLPWRPQEAARDRDGRIIGVISEAAGQAMILDLNSQSPGRELRHVKGNSLAVTPDGRWVATAGWHSALVRLWDSLGNQIHEWRLSGQNEVTFTPDSRTLIISRPGEFSFWDLETLKPRLDLTHDVFYPSHPAFSFDQKMMAVEMSPGVIHLKDAATGRTIAKLENPFRERSTWMAFNSDATQLIVVSRYAKTIRTWDLARIREALKPLGLDWQWPTFHPSIRASIQSHSGLTDSRGEGLVHH